MRNKSKATVAAPVVAAPVVAPTVAIAPVVGTQGKASPGGHVKAWRACPALPLTGTVALTGTNPWRPGTPGHAFYGVLAATIAANPSGCTVSDVVAAYGKGSQPHLRWLYTWGPWLTVNGATFGSAGCFTQPVAAA